MQKGGRGISRGRCTMNHLTRIEASFTGILQPPTANGMRINRIFAKASKDKYKRSDFLP
jgi:hypothetical protein